MPIPQSFQHFGADCPGNDQGGDLWSGPLPVFVLTPTLVGRDGPDLRHILRRPRVIYALKEHDIKKLLAYHSIENIGIIVIGIGFT